MATDDPTDFRQGAKLLGIMISEIVILNCRFRALVETLSDGAWDDKRFAENFRRIEERDREGLSNSIILTPEAFMREFASWNQADVARINDRYGTDHKRRPV